MKSNSDTPHRKADHIRINLNEDVQSGSTTGLEKFHFVHQALPEMDLSDVDTMVIFLGKELRLPILLSSMSGGTMDGWKINQNLAKAAEVSGVAFGLGSIRAAIENDDLKSSFQVRKIAPNALVLVNLGAVQLNYGYTIEHCNRAMDMTQADGLILHLNPLQEALQPEGNSDFSHLLEKIEKICKGLKWPVIVKEVGWGISSEVARKLRDAGVAAIDVAAAGGTSWSQVEKYRIKDRNKFEVAGAFRDWGIPLVDSILQVQEAAPGIPIIASGGLKNGIDLGKSIALGATLGGFAGAILKAAVSSYEQTLDQIKIIESQLRIAMFASGMRDIEQLKHASLTMD
jgi:isopentenyl-diphosphate delta-isomerase